MPVCCKSSFFEIRSMAFPVLSARCAFRASLFSKLRLLSARRALNLLFQIGGTSCCNNVLLQPDYNATLLRCQADSKFLNAGAAPRCPSAFRPGSKACFRLEVVKQKAAGLLNNACGVFHNYDSLIIFFQVSVIGVPKLLSKVCDAHSLPFIADLSDRQGIVGCTYGAVIC